MALIWKPTTKARALVALLGMGALLSTGIASSATVTTTRISVAPSGDADRPSSQPAISSDGRFVAFTSSASNLVPNDTNGIEDVFVADRRAGTLERVSVSSDGTEGTSFVPAASGSSDPAISADGRWVAFTSDASGLADNEPINATDVYLHDRLTHTTIAVTRPAPNAQGGMTPSLSADGATLAYECNQQICVYDRAGGTSRTVSLTWDGRTPEELSVQPTISADGTRVAFWSRAGLAYNDHNNAWDVYVVTLATNAPAMASTDRYGAVREGDPNGPSSRSIDLSSDARYVAFASTAATLVAGDTNRMLDVFRKDMTTGAIERVDLAPSRREVALGASTPTISADGALVAFASRAPDLVAGDSNNASDIFVRDVANELTWRWSLTPAADQADLDSTDPAMTADASTIAFASSATNLDTADDNAVQDIYVRGPVPAPLPAAPMITSPEDEATITSEALTVAGTAAAGLTVIVREGAATLGSATATADGTWSVPLSLGDGSHTLTAVARNASGDESLPSAPRRVTVDTTLPPQVETTIERPLSSAVLNSLTVAFGGSATPGAHVTITEGTATIAQADADGAGAWSASSTVTEGAHTVVVTATDSYGRTSAAPARTFTVDVTAPAVPVIAKPDGLTTITSAPVIASGSSDPQVKIEILEGSAVVGIANADAQGAWSGAVGVSSGTHTIAARAVDAAGNRSPLSAARTFTVDLDTTAPVLVITTSNDAAFLPVDQLVIEGEVSDNRTVSRIQVDFRPAWGSVVRATATCTGCEDGSGSWSVEPRDLAPGRYTVIVSAYDANNNRGRASITIVNLTA